MKKKLKKQGLNLSAKAGFASVLLLALPVMAQNPTPTRMEQDKPSDNKPSGIPWGPVTAYPEVDATFKSNDNIYQRPSSSVTGTRSDHIFVVAPKLKIEALDGPNTYNLTYRIENGNYLATSSANYTDHTLGASGKWVFSGRSGLKVDLGYSQIHEDQSNTPGVGVHANPDKYNQTSWNALYGYGAEGAQGRFELEVGQVNKAYTNFKTDAAGNPDNTKRDHDDTKFGGTFFWRVAPKTQLVFQAVQTKYDYKQNSIVGWTAPDSTERKFLVGVTWEATANTTGIFKVGNIKKDFDSAALSDFSKSGWEGTIKWSPLTYSTVDFTSSRLPSEASLGNLSSDTRHGVVWNHAWNSRLSSAASYNYTGTDFVGNAGVVQSDKLNTYGLKLNYQWMRTVKFGVGYDRSEKTSSNPSSEYKKNLWSIFMNAAI